MNNFNNLNISNDILKGIEKKNFVEMTEVQEKVIPIALQRKDIIAQAPTGTGKTGAFAIPILQNIDINNRSVQAVILSPTRELAVQITEEIKELAHFIKRLNVLTVYGGEHIERQITGLKRNPQIVVATPGRLMDHIRRNTIKLDQVTTFVLDEADVMLDMGFREDIDTILNSITNNHQTMLFSATISKQIAEIARNYLQNPVTIRTTKEDLSVPTIKQYYIEVAEKNKIEVMSRLININDYKISIVFCNTKRMVDEVSSKLMQRGFLVEALHGDMKQMQRDRVMQRFKSGAINILVASDVAARGLDIDDVEVVFNYDVPTDEEYYVHRIGRTGRARKEGVAISLVTRAENFRLRQIMAYSKSQINRLDIPTIDNVLKFQIEHLITQASETSPSNIKVEKALENVLADLTETNKDELIKGLILMQLNEVEDSVDLEETKPRTRKSKITRLFVGLGKNDGIKKYTLSDLIVKNSNLKNRDINNIDIYDSFSFLEIPSESVNEVIFALSQNKYRGRKITVEEAKEKRRSKKK